MKINVIVFGSTGMLGNTLYKYLTSKNDAALNVNVITINRKDFDVLNDSFQKLSNLITIHNPHFIINCIGLIPQKTHINTLHYYTINSEFPKLLSLICTTHNYKFIHITTDCIYSGKKGRYNENDKGDSCDDYGKSKYLGEKNIENNIGNLDYIILRTSIIGTESNSKVSLLEWFKSNKGGNVNGYINHYWNGVTTLQLSKIIYKIITNISLININKLHVFSPENVSKYKLLTIINDIYKLDVNINNTKNINTVNRTLSSIYNIPSLISPRLSIQIQELKLFTETHY